MALLYFRRDGKNFFPTYLFGTIVCFLCTLCGFLSLLQVGSAKDNAMQSVLSYKTAQKRRLCHTTHLQHHVAFAQ